jgi:DNA-binding beta-propeller fold protein YncE
MRRLLLTTVVACLGVAAFAGNAAADSVLCSAGSGAGQCEAPEGVAVDHSNGHVYVVDEDNNRVDVFDSAGGFLFAFGWGVADGTTNGPQICTVTCAKGIAGSGAGQIDAGFASIAIDNDPASPAYHSVYVGEQNGRRVQRFSPGGEFILMIGKGVNKTTGKDLCTAVSENVCGAGSSGGGDGELYNFPQVAVGVGGLLLVADTARSGGQTFEAARVQSFDASGAFVSRLVLLGEPSKPNALAADSTGDFYLGSGGETDALRKYGPSGEEIKSGAFPLTVHNLRSLGVDSADNLFTQETDSGNREITKYDSAGDVLSRFGYDSIEGAMIGIVPTDGGGLYATETSEDRAVFISAPAPGPLSCCLQATADNTKATLKGGVNPEGKAATYHLEYITQADYAANGNSFSGAHPATSTPESASVGPDFDLHNAEAQIGCASPQDPPQPTCLVPGTEYRYRLVAKGEDGQNSAEGQFKTLPPFEIKATWATEVGTDAAQLHATVNPLGISAKGQLEYVDDVTYQADVEASGAGHGFDHATVLPEADFGLGNADVSTSASLSGLPSGTTYHYRLSVSDSFTSDASPEHTFTTFALPNPPSNSCSNEAFRTGPSALLPGCRAYEMVSPVDKNGGDVKVLGSTLNYPARLEESSAGGSRYAYSSVTAFADAVSAPWTSEYIATRHEGQGWDTHAISPPRQSSSITETPSFKFDVQYKDFSENLSQSWLIHDTDPPLDPACAPEGVLNLYRRDNTTETYEALTTAKATNIGKDGYELELQGVSANGTDAVFRANGAMVTDEGPAAAKNGLSQLYMHSQGEGCGKLRLASVLPNGKAATTNSSLGTFNVGIPGESRVNPVTNAVSADGSLVFWTTVGATEATLYVRDMDAGKTAQIAAGGITFGQATPDGSTAYYTLGSDLYEIDTAKALAGEAASTLLGEGIPGFSARLVAATSNTSRLYFIAYTTLGGEGEAGKPNLYLREDNATRLVATLLGNGLSLPGGDVQSGYPHQGFTVGSPSLVSNGVRASADGSHLAFVSAGSPTGYDNADAKDGRPNLEVYLYDAEADHLACISCNPTGARPTGREFKAEDSANTRQIAARLPAAYNQFATPQVLSEDGNRLFFESYEALLARDTNGKDDVYEWQRAANQEACDEMGAELYVPSAGGCLSLISSGQSAIDSEIADASPDGSDVFIRTAASLLPQDPGQVDVYDARVNGGFAQPPAQPAACEGEACQGTPSPPNDPTPASSAFQGAGNVKEGAAKPRCRKGATKRKGRCVAKKHSKAKHHKRANDHRGATR